MIGVPQLLVLGVVDADTLGVFDIALVGLGRVAAVLERDVGAKVDIEPAVAVDAGGDDVCGGSLSVLRRVSH